MNLEIIDQVFKEYVDNYDMKDPNINLKYYHTLQVVYVAELMAKELHLNEEDTNLIKVISYLHDIGRFEQLRTINSFDDSKFDHAEYGVKILFGDNFIEKFKIDKKYYAIIEKSILYHNRYDIDENSSDREAFFERLIRDCDKIDIYRATYNKKIDFVDLLPSPKVMEEFKNRQQIHRENVKNACDSIVTRLAFLFDFNFKESFKVLNELGYFQMTISNIIPKKEIEKEWNDIKSDILNFFNSNLE